MKTFSQNFVKVSGNFKCLYYPCGKVRNTLRSLQKHQKKAHPGWTGHTFLNPKRESR